MQYESSAYYIDNNTLVNSSKVNITMDEYTRENNYKYTLIVRNDGYYSVYEKCNDLLPTKEDNCQYIKETCTVARIVEGDPIIKPRTGFCFKIIVEDEYSTPYIEEFKYNDGEYFDRPKSDIVDSLIAKTLDKFLVNSKIEGVKGITSYMFCIHEDVPFLMDVRISGKHIHWRDVASEALFYRLSFPLF